MIAKSKNIIARNAGTEQSMSFNEKFQVNGIMSINQTWEDRFRGLYERVKMQMQSGERNLEHLLTDEDRLFLRSIGSKPIEIFDAVDDFLKDGVPSWSDILDIHRMRYHYFTEIQKGTVPPLKTQYRAKSATLGGIAWLPRAIDKARAKLQGCLIDDLFYPCGGDRRFLKEIQMSAPEFFRLVRGSASDEEILQKIHKRPKFDRLR